MSLTPCFPSQFWFHDSSTAISLELTSVRPSQHRALLSRWKGAAAAACGAGRAQDTGGTGLSPEGSGSRSWEEVGDLRGHGRDVRQPGPPRSGALAIPLGASRAVRGDGEPCVPVKNNAPASPSGAVVISEAVTCYLFLLPGRVLHSLPL